MTAAVILAAGMGTRLLPLTHDRPKALVEVAGVTLLERLIDACAAAGLEEAVVVTGYQWSAIEAWLAEHETPIPASTVFNEAFDTRGNAWSLYVAREAIAGRDFIKLDGDLLLEPTILRGLLDHPVPSALALDVGAQLDHEAMKAQLREDGMVRALGKWLRVEEASGESIGVEKIAAEDAALVFDTIAQLMADDPSGYYEDAYHRLVESGRWQLGAFDIGRARWIEIDCASDLERAREMFGTG